MATHDSAKRRRVMQRSQALGHCVCDPRKPCPCPALTEEGYCPCAGERPAAVGEAVRLTALVHNAGCASKIAPADLEAVLARLPAVTDPAVVSGIPAGDDAGVYRLAEGVTLVQTVDMMTPCVDDPETFGRICAANCLSDIYAMGGTPRTALSILAFPSETLDGHIMYAMMRGAMEVLTAAGVALIGGHSIKDEEIKLGFAITGTVDESALTERGSARAGDVLVLTKPLGTGVLSFARQVGREYDGMAEAEEAMATLNRDAADAAREAGASACTDVTGFGLFGHLAGMVRHSGVTATVDAEALPAFPGALEALRDGVVPGAVERNMESVGEDIGIGDGVEEARVHLGFDAQTSGGLLIAIPEDRHAALLEALSRRGVMGATIGRIVGTSDGRIEVGAGLEDVPRSRADLYPSPSPAGEGSSMSACCGSPAEPAGAAQAFGAFMRATAADGAVSARTKELVTFALVVMSRCAPCFDTHLATARGMGISDAELEEIAWCAVAMGGAPVRMFYQEMMAGKREETHGGGCCG